MQPLFSIAIPTFNSLASLKLVLRCLEVQAFAPGDFGCVVVDDGSTDGTAEFLQSYRPAFGFKSIINRHNTGRAQARDLAWRKCNGEIVIFLDSDMLPSPHWLEQYRQAFAAGAPDVVSGTRYNLQLDARQGDRVEELARWAGTTPEQLFVANIAEDQFRLIDGRARLGQYAHPVYEKLETEVRQVYASDAQSLICCWSFMASNAAVRRSLLQRTSGFNPCMVRGDDLELAIRLWEIGARFGFADEAQAIHLGGAEQTIYWPTMNDLATAFCRHPYRLVLMMHLWRFYHSPDHSSAVPPGFEHLLSLHRDSQDASPPDILEQCQRIYKQPFPANCRYSRDELIEFFSLSPFWTPEQAADGLDLAVSRGLYVESREGQLYFDNYHTDNWLRDCTSIMERWLAPFVLNHNKTPFQDTQQPSKLLSFDCRGTYEVIIPAEALAGVEGQLFINLSLPVEHICQSEVRLTNCSPSNLLEYRDRAGGMAVNIPLVERGGEEIRIGYDFTCRMHEFAPVEKERGEVAASPAELARHLRPSFPPKYMVRARSLLDQIITDKQAGPYNIARMIYMWIQHQVLFTQTPFHFPYFLIMDTGFGPCTQLTRLFVNLCRLSGIPARELCGAPVMQDAAKLLRDFNEGTTYDIDLSFRGYTPFIHTWAEFYDPARGWLPVEIHGFGEKCVTALNIVDEHFVEEVREIYAEIYKPLLFGSMAPFRIYTSEQANKQPVYPLVKNGGSIKGLPEVTAATLYNLRCSFSSDRVSDDPSLNPAWPNHQGLTTQTESLQVQSSDTHQ
jgi:GT2 family glycosyltransferase